MDMYPMTETDPALAGAGGTPLVPVTARRRLGFPAPRWLRLILSDRKAAVGVAILTFFVLVAIFGPLIWRGDPNVGDFTVRPQQPPSARINRAATSSWSWWMGRAWRWSSASRLAPSRRRWPWSSA